MISKMKPVSEGGSRIAIVFNGSPLFTGAAGSGESEIRRWIIENDWLEAVVALPDQLFYNTGSRPTSGSSLTARAQSAGARCNSLMPGSTSSRCGSLSATNAKRSAPSKSTRSLASTATSPRASGSRSSRTRRSASAHHGGRPLRLRWEVTADAIAIAGERSVVEAV